MAFEVDMTNFPDSFLAAYKQFTPTEKQRWKEARYRALTDELYLASEVLDMDFQVNPHRYLFKKFLKKSPGTPLYDLDVIKKKRMVLWSRGVFKTSSVVVEIVQLIINYPDIRILFLTGGFALAKAQLGRVKKIFERPPKMFLHLFPEFCGKKLGNQTLFNVPCQSATRSYAEPTMTLTTARSVTSGSHYDVICVDDLVNNTNYRSVKALEKCMQDYRDICPLLAPDGFLYITGTRYSFGDAYEQIQELAQKEMDELGTNSWIFSTQSCWTRVCNECGHGDVAHDFDSDPDGPCAGDMDTGQTCPCRHFVDSGAKGLLFPKFRKKNGETEGLSIEKLRSEKIALGDEFFACQYECSPISSSEQVFTEDLISKQTVWHEHQYPNELQAPCFFMCDFSYVGQDDRDVTVIYAVRVWMGRLYVIDCCSGKWDAWSVVQNLFAFAARHRPTVIWIEGFNGWDAYNNNIEIYARDNRLTKLPVVWKPVTQGKGAKTVRIGAIKGTLAQGRLYIYGHMPEYQTLFTQLMRWPKLGKHDDYADCLGLVCEAPTGTAVAAIPKEDMSALSFIRNLHKETEDYDTRICGTF